MAANTPKPILPLLEGRIGELRKMRFWSKVNIGAPEQCWEWRASTFGSGYGRFKIANHIVASANRVALVIHTGKDCLDLFALHQCDNPRCCNPHHLYWGTHSDNMKDMIVRKRRRPVDQSGARNGAAKLSPEHHRAIVDRLKRGWSNTFIAQHLPVTASQVSAIRRGIAWREQSIALGWEPKPMFKRKTRTSAALSLRGAA